jgi:hypothetical protein
MAISLNRKRVYAAARAHSPIRWSGDVKNWDYIEEVHLSPEKEKIKDIKEVVT